MTNALASLIILNLAIPSSSKTIVSNLAPEKNSGALFHLDLGKYGIFDGRMSTEMGIAQANLVDFFGSFEMTCDRTQRVLFPRKLKEAHHKAFGENERTLRVLVTNDRKDYPNQLNRTPIPFLQLFPVPVFRHYLGRLHQAGKDSRRLLTACEELEFDEGGRIRLTSRLLQHLCVDAQTKEEGANVVVFSGSLDSILVYSSQGFQRHQREMLENPPDMDFNLETRTGDFAFGSLASL